MVTETEPKTIPEPKITIEFSPASHGWSNKILDIRDATITGEITLSQKEAVKLARKILKITKEQK